MIKDEKLKELVTEAEDILEEAKQYMTAHQARELTLQADKRRELKEEKELANLMQSINERANKSYDYIEVVSLTEYKRKRLKELGFIVEKVKTGIAETAEQIRW